MSTVTEVHHPNPKADYDGPMHSLRGSLAALLVVSSISSAQAQESDWPNWRGPTSNGLAAEDAEPPLHWGEDKNIRWKVPLPGLGCSSPIIVGDRIYLTTAIDLEVVVEGQAPGAQPDAPNAEHRHQFVVMAFSRATGKEQWRTPVHEAKPHAKGHNLGSHASASIVCSADRVIAFFGSRGLYGLDLDGKVIWSKQFGEMKTLAGFGEGASPALHGDTLVVQWDEEGPSFVAAFNVVTGKELWRQSRKSGSSWGTPLITEVDGQVQLILTGSDATVGYALKTGKSMWTCGGMSKNPVNSPLVVDGVLYVMNSYKGRVIQALKLAGAKGELDLKEDLLWTLRRDASYVPSPIVVGDRLYYLRDSTGVLNRRNAVTGKRIGRSFKLRGVKRIHASPIAASGRIYITARGGKTIVLKEGDELKLLATNTLDDVLDATPAFVGKQVFVRGRNHLYCIAEDG